MKKVNKKKNWHEPKSPVGMGDSYGSGVLNPVGRMRESYMDVKVKPKKMGKVPKSLA